MSARRHQRALDAIARRYRMVVAAASDDSSAVVQTRGGLVVVLHPADATVADVRRLARRGATVFRGRGRLPDDRTRELTAASCGVQGSRPFSVAMRAWDRAQARRGWAS